MEKLQETGNPKICPTIAIIKNNQLLIGLRHYTPEKWQMLSVWTIPGGRCDDNEKIENALKREVAEEIGITDLNITDFLGEVEGVKDKDIVYVFAGNTNQEPKLLEPEKFSEWKWQDIDKIPENFINLKSLVLIKNFINKQHVKQI